MGTSLQDAAKKLVLWKSLVKIADRLGFFLTDQFGTSDCEFVLTPKKNKRSLAVLVELHDQNGFHGNFPLVYLTDEEDVITALCSLALGQGLCLDLDRTSGKAELCKFDKWSAKDLIK